MMFFTIHASKTAEGAVANEIFNFPDLSAAKANHFYFLSSAYSNASLTYFMSEVIDVDGVLIDRESWHANEE